MIMTCVDHFSKIVVLVPLGKSNAWSIATDFLAEAVSHRQILSAIIHKRDPRFQGNF